MTIGHRSLSPECTPLKHRYDSCFNLWFEGYLQPALDTTRSVSYPTPIASPSLPQVQSAIIVQQQAEPQTQKRTLITSWANAFSSHRSTTLSQTKPRQPTSSTLEGTPLPAYNYPDPVYENSQSMNIDTAGKTRAQIKAEEYERACGQLWKDYQGCLMKAIEENESLTQLLEQAREEHPLKGMDKLEGTAWDPKANLDNLPGKN
ncbi:hypothetical protein I315_03325 [Cryptococcus gattii Ru294]|uniref:Uncharacterized protein n=1 Tax=Cryptococcus gattii EJB2 TaxID=1296103 RepID=A0ABR5BWN7_9TREE|nr:hypothetical protein I315_03325 [Cryptococcus gattii Ru294]KIR80065.1 hypothetical protein I306_03029 [Cryptococcus gattii EJB2]KIY34292.1 hypothetical protein I305_03072 [Cryptococcus gattii E566]KJE05348.1 hypothetical protein I311_01027 [Cryptococcus gattii NT-10]